MSASSSSHTNTAGRTYARHDWEEPNSYDDSQNAALDFYDVYQQQRHDHYVAILEPILRGEVSTAVADKEKENEDFDGNLDGGSPNSESDASYDEDNVELGKRSCTDHGSMTTKGANTSHTAELATEATRRAIILSTVPPAKRTRAHLDAFYGSLQLGPKQLQLLGQPNRKNMTKLQREAYLNADVWIKAGTIEPYKVTCAGCDKSIALEKPRTGVQKGNEYYAGNWNKHRNHCGEVYRKWCERNGLEPDEGKGKSKEGGKVDKKGAREVRALPTRRRASLASIPVNVIA